MNTQVIFDGQAMDHQEATRIVQEIFALYRQYGKDYMGRRISQIEHVCQTAQLAEEEGYDEEIILAAFFHDIGHLCEHIMPGQYVNGYGVVDHEKLGADFLRSRGFSPTIANLVENHVQSRRYLAYHYLHYYEQLSATDKRTLELQGGLMTLEEAMAFESDSLFEMHIKLRHWDEEAKLEHQPLPSTDKYAVMALRHLEKQ